MSFYRKIEDQLVSIIKDLDFAKPNPKNLLDGLSVEQVKDKKHGDLATNVAMIMSGKLNMPAKEIAEKISKNIQKITNVESVSIAGPGFINIKMKKTFWFEQLAQVLVQGEDYGKSKSGKNEKINIEFGLRLK